MEKHNLKSGFSIYFADVHFEKQVYAFGSGLGFTSVIYAYSLGRDPEEAEKLALEKYDSDETKVKKVHVNLARSRTSTATPSLNKWLALLMPFSLTASL
ncbi:hypothetical protein [Klebsiella pneumoniae]|uniref:hypothetical protein n=1 Tax=Klebsiella pneumoniae TaxID=573 RepID=UPI00210ED514|nr:hypothetical protein [Klebsiella pneumoniae]